jgi:hypothetical protein
LSCNNACKDPVGAPYTDCAGLPAVKPSGWASYYGEQLKTIEFARNNSQTDSVLGLVDWDAGVGIAGHSMGGQATTLSSHKACTAKWGIKAASDLLLVAIVCVF